MENADPPAVEQLAMKEETEQLVLTASVAAFSVLALSACVTTTRTDLVAAEASSECVVLLHGLNRSYRAMSKMATSLQAAGYTTANVDYPSQTATIEGLAAMAVTAGCQAEILQTQHRAIKSVRLSAAELPSDNNT